MYIVVVLPFLLCTGLCGRSICNSWSLPDYHYMCSVHTLPFPSLQILIPTYSFVLNETFLVIIFVMVFQIIGQQVVVVLVDALTHFQSVYFFRIVNEVVVLESECAYTKS